jgi:hypothetical protein
MITGHCPYVETSGLGLNGTCTRRCGVDECKHANELEKAVIRLVKQPDLVSPWHPMQDPVDVKTLGKLTEELGEGVQVVARCLIQGIGELHPISGKSNKIWLEEEIADIEASIELVKERFKLNRDAVSTRKQRKIVYLRQWHEGA